MKRKISLTILIIIALIGAGVYFLVPGKEGGDIIPENIKIVEAIEQTEAMEHPAFKLEAFEPVIPDGTNVALEAKATANNMGPGIVPRKSNDDNRNTYYEGAPDEFPNELTLDLKGEFNIHAVKVLLCPDAVWAKRVQTIEILAGIDPENLDTVVPPAEYEFDPKTGNEIVIEFDAVNAQYVMFRFTANTGAVGGQAAEVQVYALD